MQQPKSEKPPDGWRNEITRGAPCKVEKLTKKANLTEMENLAKIGMGLANIQFG